MKYFRFTDSDSNYRRTPEGHIWDLPLALRHRRVGLSSFSMDLIDDWPADVPSVIISCNLLDRTMENQTGILEVVPIKGETFQNFSRLPYAIGIKS